MRLRIARLTRFGGSSNDERPHLVTHVDTILATTHEARRTETTHQKLADKNLARSEHLTTAAAVTFARTNNWLIRTPLARTPTSPFPALAA